MLGSIRDLETAFDGFTPSLPDIRTREMRLERMERILSFLGNPERAYRTYHVAGSKGKGTTSAYLAALLTGSGRKCGLYLSPHLYTIRERFTLSSSFFDDSFYIDTANELLGKLSSFTLPESLGPGPTTFEAYTAYGYLLFQRAGCTDAVIETGLGGRLDATNTISPDAVLLTPIELEHTQILGDTVAKIAAEKSKIIRPGVPVFSSARLEDARRVFEEEARANGSSIMFIDREISSFEAYTGKDGEHLGFSLDGRSFSLTLAMASRAMAENAALSILAAKRLGFLTDKGISLLEKTALPGRLERRDIEGRHVVIDCAHTAASARSALESFNALAAGRKVLIFSAVEGKDIKSMISILLPAFSTAVISKPDEWKKSDPESIYRLSKELFPDKDIIYIPDRNEALDKALSLGDDILITGSFYLPSGMEKLL